jgi:hypothetical protein
MIDPVTAITAAQTAMSVVRMLQGGSDSSALVQLQIEMLNAISRQLTAISDGIKTILENVERLEGLVLEVPKATVAELYTAKILGAQSRYVQLMKTYNLDLTKFGIEGAQERNSERIDSKVLSNLNEAITDLTGYTSSTALTPVIAAAAFVHVHASIMANAKSSLVVPQLQTYVEWLASALGPENPNSIVSSLARVKRNLEDSNKAVDALRPFYHCASDWWSDINEVSAYVGYTPHSFYQIIDRKDFDSQLGGALNQLNEETGAGLVLQTAELTKFAKHTHEGTGRSWRGQTRPADIPPDCDAAIIREFDEANANRLASSVTKASLQVFLLTSWESSARTALGFLESKIALFADEDAEEF